MKIEVLVQRNFGDVGIQIIQAEGSDDTIWFSGKEVGKALELKEPKKAIHLIYQRHKDELEEFSILWTIETPGGP